MEDPDIASELACPTVAIEGHASGPGGGKISAGESSSALNHGRSKCQAFTAAFDCRIVKWWPINFQLGREHGQLAKHGCRCTLGLRSTQ